MNLAADSTIGGTAAPAAQALRLSQQRSAGSHRYLLDPADSFLVSDDEEELLEPSNRHRHATQHSMAKDDYSPIPVRNLQRRSATSKRNMVKAASIPLCESEETKILLPHDRPTKKTPLGLALQPRFSWNLHAINTHRHEPSTSTALNLQLQAQTQPQLQPQNLGGPRFPNLAATVATAIATVATANADDFSHNHHSDGSNKRVTFSPQVTTTPHANMTASSSHARMRTRSQSIAIQKKQTSTSSMDYSSNDDYSPEDASYNEQLYDSATWRMYHRIVEHRQNQQQQRYHQRGDSSSSSDSSSHNDSSFAAVHTSSKTAQAQQQALPHDHHPSSYVHNQGYYAPPPSSSASSTTNMDEDDDEGVFEMEL